MRYGALRSDAGLATGPASSCMERKGGSRMVSVYEVRIGNRYIATPCFAFPTDGEITLEVSHVVRFARVQRDITQYLSGVPVTNDWLAKAGFVFSTAYAGSVHFELATLKSFMLMQGMGSPPWRISMHNAYARFYSQSQGMLYVHQLQDAYQSLMGEPLPLPPAP